MISAASALLPTSINGRSLHPTGTWAFGTCGVLISPFVAARSAKSPSPRYRIISLAARLAFSFSKRKSLSGIRNDGGSVSSNSHATAIAAKAAPRSETETHRFVTNESLRIAHASLKSSFLLFSLSNSSEVVAQLSLSLCLTSPSEGVRPPSSPRSSTSAKCGSYGARFVFTASSTTSSCGSRDSGPKSHVNVDCEPPCAFSFVGSVSCPYTARATACASLLNLVWSCTGFSSTFPARDKHATITATGSSLAKLLLR
mmetsp:Transcript_7856/g.26102  ORF Transcript_7856/g.26102 Transcript_7856/m.26102 type:complete len:257 (+) Transcript_7856:128-898(+)